MQPTKFSLQIALLTLLTGVTAQRSAAQLPPSDSSESRPFDAARAKAAGLHEVSGKHLALYTDLPSSPEIDTLPALFDAAVPLWAAYFGIDPATTAQWQVRAYLIRDRDKFVALGLMPAGRDLVNGYADATVIWVLDQPSDYYRRHLVLHEGTHAFMTTFLGGCGPGWYSEGMAELLATHRIDSGNKELALNTMPRSREEVPMLGRIKLVRDAVAAGDALSIEAIMAIDGRRQQEPQAYAWCWALARFLDSHPRYRARFRRLSQQAAAPEFNDRMRSAFVDDWPQLTAEWRAYLQSLDYGYDFERMAIDFKTGARIDRTTTAKLRTDRGWQSSGIWLEAGKTYRIQAAGRFQIAAEQGVEWTSEPGGVTIEYYDGKPLGMLLGAIVLESDGPRPAEAGLAAPFDIGLGTDVTPSASGTLYLRVNDSAAQLGDNRGGLTIEVEPR